MFTGIVEAKGKIISIQARGDAYSISIGEQSIAASSEAGDSVAVNGVCLTIVRIDGPAMVFDAVKETVSRTTVPEWKTGMEVNLEQALTPSSRLGGHIVQGHVDGTGSVVRLEKLKTGKDLFVKAGSEYMKYLVTKGSVAVDGVSLTVAEIKGDTFRVSLVPFTLEKTTLKEKQPGSKVNIETDILGRYVEQFLGGGTRLTEEKIKKSGFGEKP